MTARRNHDLLVRIADRLKKAGGNLVAPPEGFCVQDTEGPLKPGELIPSGLFGPVTIRRAAPTGAAEEER